MGVMLIINGLANNTVIPIAAKLAVVYNISDAYVSSPVILSFLVYSLMNFPANHIIDTRGLRMSFLLGSGLFTAGVFLYTMVNKGYFFTLLGAILVAIGQPFIINCPAKIATYWFFDHNVNYLIILETICNIFDDWAHAHWNRFRIRPPNLSRFWIIEWDWGSQLNILPICWIVFSFSDSICFGVSFHAQVATNSPINRRRTIKDGLKIIIQNLPQKQELMGILYRIYNNLWNIAFIQLNSKSSIEAIRLFGYINSSFCTDFDSVGSHRRDRVVFVLEEDH